MKKKIFLVIMGILIVACIVLSVILLKNKNNVSQINDGERFSQEYTQVDKDNVFVYKNIDEIINILEHGTGIVYLGFPECPWCKQYVVYLNEVAKQNKNVSNVYYFDILEDRKNNTEEYQKIVSILSDYLPFNEEGNKRVYVPAVIAVNNGEIVGFDDETSLDTKGYNNPKEYWANEDLAGLKNKLNTMMDAIKVNYCTSDCNK